ncbi:MAG: hypothetical protein D3924_11995 [Candidatus Electrothrix sp. AR4]|nr:hypothetical protein [Candidatus Electrothrix sp. AR4]
MNPYKILHITPEATPREIVQAAASALRDKKYSARDIAEARKQLMNPATKLILDFVHSVDLEPLIKDAAKVVHAEEALDIEQMERLDIFDHQV